LRDLFVEKKKEDGGEMPSSFRWSGLMVRT